MFSILTHYLTTKVLPPVRRSTFGFLGDDVSPFCDNNDDDITESTIAVFSFVNRKQNSIIFCRAEKTKRTR